MVYQFLIKALLLLALPALGNGCPNECNGTVSPCYIFINNTVTITQQTAFTMCQQQGCELTPINTACDYVNMQQFRTCLPGTPNVWLPYKLVNATVDVNGASINGTWVHITTGTPLGYQKWTGGNPDGYGDLLHIWYGNMDDTNATKTRSNAAICICYPNSTTSSTSSTTFNTSTIITETPTLATIYQAFAPKLQTLTIADFYAYLAEVNYSSADYPKNLPDIPTEIGVSVQIFKLSLVSEASNTFNIDVSITLVWTDTRLNYAASHRNWTNQTFLLANFNDQQLLWRPTLFFVNAEKVSTPEVLQKNSVTFVFSDGTVIQQQRVVSTASCPMQLQYYPFDTQNCYLKLSLYGYFASQLGLSWKYPSLLQTPGTTLTATLGIPVDLTLPNFQIHNITSGTKQDVLSQDYYCGTYRPCLFVQFTLDRKLSYHVLRTFMPSTCVLIVSWLSFWIHPQNVPARSALGITTLLTLQTASASTQARLPAISHLTALDVWLLYCQISVFLCLVEFTLVHTLLTGLWSFAPLRNLTAKICNVSWKMNKSCQTDMERGSTVDYNTHKPNYLDYISRRLFPLAFCVFLTVYLSFYLS